MKIYEAWEALRQWAVDENDGELQDKMSELEMEYE